jgi:CDP-glycerol glycerophosphotransferase (TagB/SpsB family)/glycosyltransferase involved in cell wall biosynthesis
MPSLRAFRPRALARRARRLLEMERRGSARRRPVVPETVFYESFAGNGALDNPEALFRELLRDPDFAQLRHVWSLDRASGRDIRAEFAGDPRVRFVRPRSAAYLEALARSQYLITNATFPPEFQKRDGQIVVNTWHGTPLKRMGYDMPDGAYEAANTLRNFLASDFLVSQNPHMTSMYREAYRLDGLFGGRILETGYPRTDRQHLDHAGRDAAFAALRSHGIDVGDRQLVIYAPTWKGTSFTSPRDDAAELLVAVSELQSQLGSHYLVLLKAHQAVHEAVAAQAGGRGTGPLVSNDVPTNLLLGITDVLITDYSSIFIDFLGIGRPIVFYTPDQTDYQQERGTYFGGDDLPGPVVTTIPALARVITSPNGAHDRTAERWRAEFTHRDDGAAAARVIDAVFRAPARATAQPSQSTAERPSALPSRHRVLLYLGGMRSNGITTSALNLLAHLDLDRYDVSVLLARPRTRDQRANAARIDSRVRQFHRVGGLTGRLSTEAAMRVLGRLRPGHRERAWERQLWEGEWRRMTGGLAFDTVIDFSGYSRFWSEVVLHSPPARRLIWLHNDMAAEVNRPVGGRRAMRRSLPAVFALYSRFDGLISVSASLSDRNADALAARYRVPRKHFQSVRNVIDEVSARERLRQPLREAAAQLDPETGAIEHPAWAERLLAERNATWFVTVGRLSPEKNQTRLLDAFALVHRERADTRLILVGDGPLRAQLETHRDALGLSDAVVFTGALANPFAVLAHADCFVLSSDYEGQPMVLLEAAVAQLPIVSVRFGSVADALPDGSLHIVDQTVSGLAQGLRDYLDGAVPDSGLDAEAYNALALREFDTATELSSTSSLSSSAVSSSAREISANRPTAPRRRSRSTTTTAATISSATISASSTGEKPRHN